MGMYYEHYVNVDLSPKCPPEVIEILEHIVDGMKHKFYEEKGKRWEELFWNGSFYTPNTRVAELTYCPYNKAYSLIGKGDSKSYMRDFFEWITPYLEMDNDDCDEYENTWTEESDFMGYIRYESSRVPELIYRSDFMEGMNK